MHKSYQKQAIIYAIKQFINHGVSGNFLITDLLIP
jgi:hypothetical protein